MRLIQTMAAVHEIAFGKAWVRTDSGPNKHDDYLSMASGASPTYNGSAGCMLIGIRNWLSDRPFPNGRDVYGDTIVLLKSDGTTKEVYAYPLHYARIHVFTPIRGDAIVRQVCSVSMWMLPTLQLLKMVTLRFNGTKRRQDVLL